MQDVIPYFSASRQAAIFFALICNSEKMACSWLMMRSSTEVLGLATEVAEWEFGSGHQQN